MKKVNKVLRYLFGSKPSYDSYRIWAKTEYGRDWRYAYEYMIRSKGNTPPRADLTNRNFQGWV